jgi:hypothetical protein
MAQGIVEVKQAHGVEEETPVTEDEWLACADPTPMLEYLRGKGSERKLRLFAVACCRRIWHLLTDERSRRALIVLESYTEGIATIKELYAAAHDAQIATNECANNSYVPGAVRDALGLSLSIGETEDDIHPEVVGVPVESGVPMVASWAVGYALHPQGMGCDAWDRCVKAEQVYQCRLLHDIFGNAFRPITLNPSWLTPTVKEIAEAIYQERVFDRLLILADALEDAGCDNADILEHCRGPGPHVLGCWVVDLILGKK